MGYKQTARRVLTSSISDYLEGNNDLMNIGRLQDVIYNLEEENFAESVDIIKKIRMPVSDIARNIIRLSCFFKSKIPLLVYLVYELRSKSGLIDQIELLISYGTRIGASQFLLALYEANIFEYIEISKLQMIINAENEEVNQFQKVVEEDNIKELIEKFASPAFEIDKIYNFKVSYFIDKHKRKEMSLVEFSAMCGSVQCFKFLYINNAKLLRDQEEYEANIIDYAMAGGSIEIIQLLDQAQIHPRNLSIKYAVLFHRVEIYDWLLEYVPKEDSWKRDFSNECFQTEFVHGIRNVDSIYVEKMFKIACKNGVTSIIKFIIYKFLVKKEKIDDDFDSGFYFACENGHIDIVKILIFLPCIDINYGGCNVSNLFIPFL